MLFLLGPWQWCLNCNHQQNWRKQFVALLLVNKAMSSFSVLFHVVAMLCVSPFWVKTAAISSAKLTNLGRTWYAWQSSISGKVIARYAPELLKWMLSGTAGSVHTITWATLLVILAVYGWKSQSSRILLMAVSLHCVTPQICWPGMHSGHFWICGCRSDSQRVVLCDSSFYRASSNQIGGHFSRYL